MKGPLFLSLALRFNLHWPALALTKHWGGANKGEVSSQATLAGTQVIYLPYYIPFIVFKQSQAWNDEE